MSALLTAIAAQKRRFDPDAADYFSRITLAGSSITDANKSAVNAFIVGCKTDGIWGAIKASCLLAGPARLTGALVPLVGAAPTNYNFVEGDYSRTTGLKGDGLTKYLDSNRLSGTDPRTNCAMAVWQSTHATRDTLRAAIGSSAGNFALETNSSLRFFRINSGGASVSDTSNNAGFFGGARIDATQTISRFNGGSSTLTVSTSTPSNPIHIFAAGGIWFSDARLSFYSIGESLDLALLDARLTTYMATLS
jgi:hypothetical protein